ncbi:TOBE domain-containing protein [Sessilibacter sp. MAH4]
MNKFMNNINHNLNLARNSPTRFSVVNQLRGRVAVISLGEVNVEIVVLLSGQETLVATVGLSAFESMNLQLNSRVIVLVKENSILISNPESCSLLSTRNTLAGTVIDIKYGLINNEIALQTDSGIKLLASISHEELSEFDCKMGDQVCANFKANDVILVISNTNI